jgi:hypothetical protein
VKKEEVPQHNAKAFHGQTKALYATDDDGNYAVVGSNGWEAEEIVLDQAAEVFEQAAADAHARARQGSGSPLEYHMAKRRMDVLLLAQATGFWQWQVRRHLRPGAFESLPAPKQARYVEALDLSLQALLTLPDQP